MFSILVLAFLAGIVAGAVFLANMPQQTCEMILSRLDVRRPRAK